jgi:Glycosyltransferase like family
MQWSIVSAVNSESTLESCLLKSPGVRSAADVILQRGYPSAAAAYNAAMRKSNVDLLVFLHQDVYLPEGWFESVEKALAVLALQDPNWGVLGVWGVTPSGGRAGYVYWNGLPCKPGVAFDGGVLDQPADRIENPRECSRNRQFEGVVEVTSLDEVVLIIRKSAGLQFDENLPGYHLYGTDICLEARRQGMKSYAISAFCIHNTSIGNILPSQFWQCYLLMRRKWKQELPVTTPCTEITRGCWPMVRWNIVRMLNLVRRRHKPVGRVPDPRKLYEEIASLRLVSPLPVVKNGSVMSQAVSLEANFPKNLVEEKNEQPSQ